MLRFKTIFQFILSECPTWWPKSFYLKPLKLWNDSNPSHQTISLSQSSVYPIIYGTYTLFLYLCHLCLFRKVFRPLYLPSFRSTSIPLHSSLEDDNSTFFSLYKFTTTSFDKLSSQLICSLFSMNYYIVSFQTLFYSWSTFLSLSYRRDNLVHPVSSLYHYLYHSELKNRFSILAR